MTRGVIPAEVQSWVIRGRTDIAVFAERGLGIKLHPAQVEAAAAITSGRAAYNILTWSNRAGKAQPTDEPVLTPTGWRPIGSLAVGDLVIAGDGSPTIVTGVFPQGRRSVFRLTFDDGATTRADAEHLWRVRPPGYESWSVLTTDVIRRRWGDTPAPGQRCAIPAVPRYRPERLLVRIEPAGEAESVCIAVAHPEGTYITNDYIVTHNTTLLIVLHMWAIFYRWGIPVPESDAEEDKWGKEEYRTLHCAPLNELAGRAWLAAGDIISGTSKSQRDPATGKRRPAPLAQMFATTRERSETGADRLLLRCLNGAVVDFRSTEGKAARIEGGAWRLISWDEWPATENPEDIRFVLYVRLTARAADFDAPIVMTGTITPDTEHIAKEFLTLVDDPAVDDWWGNHAARTMNPSTTEKSLGRAKRNLDAEDYARMVEGRPGGVKGRVFPSWLIDPAFVSSLPAWQAPDKAEAAGGGPKWMYLHLWDLAIAAADNVGMVLRVPAGWKFDPANPVVGVSMKIIPGSRTLIDDEIEFAIEETWLPYGGAIHLDTTDAHGRNVYRSMRRRGLPVHPFDFKELDGGKTTRKSRGIKAIRALFAEGIDKERDAAGEPTHDELGLVAYDLGKPYGSLKFPLAWTKPKDQLSILKPPGEDERQQKDAAMVVLMGAEICERERRGASRRHQVVRAGYGALRYGALSAPRRTTTMGRAD